MSRRRSDSQDGLLRRLLQEKPSELLLALSEEEDGTGVLRWLRRVFPREAEERLLAWQAVVAKQRAAVLREAAQELEALRAERRLFNDRLREALELLREE